MKYFNNGKTYDVESTTCYEACIQVNGTTITDYEVMEEITGRGIYKGMGYSVFCDSDEICFKTFEEAYQFAMNEQKDTFRI